MTPLLRAGPGVGETGLSHFPAASDGRWSGVFEEEQRGSVPEQWWRKSVGVEVSCWGLMEKALLPVVLSWSQCGKDLCFPRGPGARWGRYIIKFSRLFTEPAGVNSQPAGSIPLGAGVSLDLEWLGLWWYLVATRRGLGPVSPTPGPFLSNDVSLVMLGPPSQETAEAYGYKKSNV